MTFFFEGCPTDPNIPVPMVLDSLTATAASSTQINLTWVDNATNEDGHKIERSPDGSTFTQVDPVSIDTISWPNTGLSAGTIYYYQVRAYNIEGNSGYSNTASASTDTVAPYLIIDRIAIEQFDNITQSYIDEVKKSLLILPGESHGRAYGYGLEHIEATNGTYDSNTNWSGAAESYATSYLRWNRSFLDNTTWNDSFGEEDFCTNTAVRCDALIGFQTVESDYTGERIYFGFGWCWDMTWHNEATGTKDPVYGCGWSGRSVDGPDGDKPWGLDAGDQSITGNSVSLQTYLDAVDCYSTNAPGVKTFYTTDPVAGDSGNEDNNEKGWQREVKYQAIGDYVETNGGILFYYADILSWD